MPPRGNPANIALGPGKLYIAPLGTAGPLNLDDVWPAAWTLLGYTNDGSSQAYAPSYEDVEVAEELEALDAIPTGRSLSVSFTLAELTSANLKAAFNGGTVTHAAAEVGPPVVRAFTTFEPPELGVEVHAMIGFEAEDGLERIFWRDCKQVGGVETARRKGAEKAGIPCEFRAFKPATGSPFTRYSGRGADAVAPA
jgi:hypothetical protein